MNTRPGIFKCLMVPFKDRDAETQARQILDEVINLIASGHTPVGITYSANKNQTDTIRKKYDEAEQTGNTKYPKTGTQGSNQADVIKQIEILLDTDPVYQTIGNQFRILPITTMTRSFFGTASNTTREWVEADLNNIEAFISRKGGTVLAWTNEGCDEVCPYAVGGGVASSIKGEEQRDCMRMIQNRLAALEQHYAPTTNNDHPEKPFGPK